MTVYKRYGNAVKDPAAINAAKAIYAEAQMRAAYSKIAVAADEAATSSHVLARLPSNALLLPSSQVNCSAITGLSDYDIGVGVNGTVLAAKGDVLTNGQTLAAAASFSPSKSVAAGSLGKQLWELAGYTADPGGVLDIIGTVNVAATAAGTIEAFILYAKA